MAPDTAKKYLATQIHTASKQQLILLVYDGAIRFCEKAVQALRENKIEEGHDALVRAQGIVVELMCALDQAVAPEFGKRLFALYNFWHLRLIEANLDHDPVRVEEVLSMMRPLRAAWAEAASKIRQNGHPLPSPDAAHAPSTSNLNLQG
jgi:flagellar protein FliS